jgi:hypothetical protein
MRDECGVSTIPSDQNWESRKSSVQKQIGIDGGLLIDPECTRLINGFVAGYSYPEISTTGIYKDKPSKNKWSHIHDAVQYVFVKLFKSELARGMAIKMARLQQEHLERIDIPGI